MRRAALVLTLAIPASAVIAPIADAATNIPAPYTNCTVFHQKYPHGVGLPGAKDHTSGKPVTTFLVNKSLYNTAIQKNKTLDKDHDGIACEQR